MSTALQKQNQKILRNLMSIPANKKCCDCAEPVAANVDVTHGIFVCTACSGIHREFGDRIKSVSMAQFTQDELNILQNQNNDTFNDKWLANFNSATDRGITPSSSDNQRRAFLIAKYQEKRWFGANATSRRRSQQQVNPFGGQTQPTNPFGGQTQPTNPFGGQTQPTNPFGGQTQQQPQQQQQQWSPFGNQPQQPAAQTNPFANKQPQQQTNPFASKSAPAQQQQQQQWSPFGNQPQQSQPQQTQPQQSQPYDDLLDLDFNNPSNPQYQKVQKMQEQHNELKGLVGLVDDPSPNSINGQPNINALRESGLGAPQGSNINMTTLTMAGFGQFTMNPGVIPNMGQPNAGYGMGGGYPNAGGYGMGGGYPNAGGYGMGAGYPNAGGYNAGMGGGYPNAGGYNNNAFQQPNQYNNFNRH